LGQGVKNSLVATLADVDDALDDFVRAHTAVFHRPAAGWEGCRPVVCSGDSDGGAETATTQDPAALTLGAATPDTVVDVVLECVLEALVGHRALGADALCHLDPHAVTGEEDVRCNFFALSSGHPFGIHLKLPFHVPW
jgi:hypothetical protein